MTQTPPYMPNAGRSKLLQLIRSKARPPDPMVSVSKSNHRNELRTLCASSGSPGDRVWETGQKKCGFCPQLHPSPSPPHTPHPTTTITARLPLARFPLSTLTCPTMTDIVTQLPHICSATFSIKFDTTFYSKPTSTSDIWPVYIN